MSCKRLNKHNAALHSKTGSTDIYLENGQTFNNLTYIFYQIRLNCYKIKGFLLFLLNTQFYMFLYYSIYLILFYKFFHIFI